MRWLKAFNCHIVEQDMQMLFCNITADIPKNRLSELQQILNDMKGVDVVKM
jgi:hypothetical protein